jgi:phenylacetaldehyde dehydrogenase
MAAAATEGTPTSLVGQFLEKPKKLLIGGKWVDASSGMTFATVNRATEEILARVSARPGV